MTTTLNTFNPYIDTGSKLVFTSEKSEFKSYEHLIMALLFNAIYDKNHYIDIMIRYIKKVLRVEPIICFSSKKGPLLAPIIHVYPELLLLEHNITLTKLTSPDCAPL